MDKKRMEIPEEQFEKFQMYLFEMDDVLEDFLRTAAAMGFELDYSPASVARIEQYWMHAKTLPDAERLEQRCARYLGEVVRKNLGGKWRLCWESPNHIFFGLPVIAGHSLPGIYFSPVSVMTNFRRREIPGLLVTAVEFAKSTASSQPKPD